MDCKDSGEDRGGKKRDSHDRWPAWIQTQCGPFSLGPVFSVGPIFPYFSQFNCDFFFHWVRFLLGSVLLLLTQPHFHSCSYSNDFNWFTKNEIINCSIPPPERRVAVRRRRGSIRRELGDNGKDNKERWEGGGCGYILMEGLGAEGKRVGRVNFLMLTSSCPSSFQHHL